MAAAPVHLRLLLNGGHNESIELAADSRELRELFEVLAARGTTVQQAKEKFFQFPAEGGRRALSFSASQLVAIISEPPVLLKFEGPAQAAPEKPPVAAVIERPRCMIIDDFLSPYEQADMLAYALQQMTSFDSGTVSRGSQNARQNLAILDFAQQAHSKLLVNRLLTWFPQIVQSLGMAPFPIQQIESQMTASNDGHYYRAHLDADSELRVFRVLTCVYYFAKEPLQFSGGALRIYDAERSPGEHRQAESFQQVEPTPNRMVVFPSNSYHELLPIRCPSRRFEDSRFAVTSWIWHADQIDPQVPHGWGHMHCAQLPANWPDGSSGEPA